MLRLITGRTGTGKTEYLTELISDTVKRSGENAVLIVPEQASFFYERKMLQILGAKDAQRAETLSFSRIAENLLACSEKVRKPLISDGGRIVLMSMALENLSEKLSVYKRYIKSVSVANELLKLSSEFKRCMITPLDLYKISGAMENCFLKEKLSEIALITETYDALVAQSFTDDTDDLTLLAEELETNSFFVGKTVFIDSFNGFTAQEYEVIGKILGKAKDVYIGLCTDSVIAQRDFDPGVFAYVKNTATKLIKLAGRVNVQTASPVVVNGETVRYKSEELSYLEKIMSGAETEAYEETASDITVIKASDVYEECAAVAVNVKRLIREENYRCREIGVLFRNSEKYEKTVRSALKKCDIPVFEDKRQPISSQPLVVLIRTACEIASGGFSVENLTGHLKTGLTDIDEEEIAKIENYALLWRVGGDRWTRDFTSSPRGFGAEISSEDIETLRELNEIRSRAVKPLVKLREKLKDASGRDISEALYRYLLSVGADSNLRDMAIDLEESGESVLAQEQERIWDTVMDILNMLAVTVGDRRVSAQRYLELFNAVISLCTLGNIPHGLDEVTVGSIDRTVTFSPRAVFVVGVNEGEFPKNTENTGILSDSDRKYLRENGIELYDFGESKASEERLMVYKTLCSSTDRIFVSYAGASSDGSQLSVSEAVRTITDSFPNSNIIDFSTVDDLDKIEGALPAFELLCLKSETKDGIYPALKEWFSSDKEFSGRMSALSRITEAKDFKIEDKAVAKELFGENMYLSASRVEKFYNCPFSYFCAYGLLARPRISSDFDAAIQGTEIHFILEMMLKKHGKEELIAMTQEERQAEVDEILEEFLLSRMGNEEKTERFMYLYRRLRKSIKEILDRLVLEFSRSAFTPIDFELRIDRDGEINPYTAALDDGSFVSLKGVVDRVDSMELNGKKYIRIVDYKSGKKKFQLSDVLSGLNMQMILYLFAIWENGSVRYGNSIVPSGFLYMPARAEYVKPERLESDESIALKKAKSLKMSGMILNDEAVILGMDDTVSGYFVPVERKDLLFTGDSLISLHQLSLLKKRVDKTIAEMAKKLKNGEIKAYPVIKNTVSACDYCEYRSVCAHEKDSGGNVLSSLSNGKCLEILEGEEVL